MFDPDYNPLDAFVETIGPIGFVVIVYACAFLLALVALGVRALLA